MSLTTLHVTTQSQASLEEITDRVQQAVRESGVRDGMCVVYLPHTTAGLLVNENADRSVATDILDALARLVPQRGSYRHLEGNSPAHIKSTLVGTSHAFIVQGGHLVLGTWQGIFLAEFDGPRRRRVLVTVR